MAKTEQTDADILDQNNALRLTGEIVAAYVSKNMVPQSDLSLVIKSVHGVLVGLASGDGSTLPAAKPAVPVKKSVTADHIICLEDGKKLKMLKRYLRSTHNLTPEEYRQKWGLPLDYPMVAPNYAARRSEFAKKIGLGRRSASSKKRKRA